MMPKQKIRPLDKLHEVGCAARWKRRYGQIICSLSGDDICEGSAILRP